MGFCGGPPATSFGPRAWPHYGPASRLSQRRPVAGNPSDGPTGARPASTPGAASSPAAPSSTHRDKGEQVSPGVTAISAPAPTHLQWICQDGPPRLHELPPKVPCSGPQRQQHSAATPASSTVARRARLGRHPNGQRTHARTAEERQTMRTGTRSRCPTRST